MAGGASQEDVFPDTHPLVLPENFAIENVGGRDFKEKFAGGKKLFESKVDNNHSHMKQSMIGSGSGDQETTAANISGGIKRKSDDIKVNEDDDKGKEGMEPSDYMVQIWSERERRKRMRDMFSQLHALLPQLSPKADKSTVVDEAVNHIKILQETLKRLKLKKLQMLHDLSTNNNFASVFQPQGLILNTRESFLANQPSSPPNFTPFSFPIHSPAVFESWISSNVTLNVCGLDAHFSICSPRKPGLLTTICFILEKYKLEIVSAQISSDPIKILFMIHAHANTSDQFAYSFPYDEVYKQAAAEIMLWVNTESS